MSRNNDSSLLFFHNLTFYLPPMAQNRLANQAEGYVLKMPGLCQVEYIFSCSRRKTWFSSLSSHRIKDIGVVNMTHEPLNSS